MAGDIEPLYTDINILILALLDKLENSPNADEDEISRLYRITEDNIRKINSLKEDSKADELEEIAAIAEAFDKSGDPELQKQASVLDEILLTIAAPEDAISKIKKAYDDELEKLREKYRAKSREEKYEEPRKELVDYASNSAKAVDKEVKTYRPLEASLSTRYSPDRPGVQMVRISDGVYQDPITKKIYNYRAGYTTDKGNKVPGGAVEYQSKDVGTHQGQSPFTTREGLVSSKY